MRARQLERAAYAALAAGLAGTWAFVQVGLEGGGAAAAGTVGLYAMTGLPFGLAAAGSRWFRRSPRASAWLLAVWSGGIVASFTVLIGSRGEPMGALAVFMLPVLHVPAVTVALLIGWWIHRSGRSRAGEP